jgi:hypothetical protein
MSMASNKIKTDNHNHNNTHLDSLGLQTSIAGAVDRVGQCDSILDAWQHLELAVAARAGHLTDVGMGMKHFATCTANGTTLFAKARGGFVDHQGFAPKSTTLHRENERERHRDRQSEKTTTNATKHHAK